MGNKSSQLFNSLIDRDEERKEMRLLMVGLDCAGKTAILYKLKYKNEKIVTLPTSEGEL